MPRSNTFQTTTQADPAGHSTTTPPANAATPPANAPWQFWIVTVIALLAGLWILAKIVPKNLFRKTTPGIRTRATLTVQGKPVSRADKPCSKCH